jgi:transcriptional regulator with XRE-family HTH domain
MNNRHPNPRDDRLVPDRRETGESTGQGSAATPASESPGFGIGVRIRHARMTRGLRLREVAAKADCSESLLSKIENDKVEPSLSVLHRIAGALNITVGELFAKANEAAGVVSRSGARPVVTMDPLRQGFGLQMERLIVHDPRHLLQGNIHIVAPHGGSEGLISHAGEEVGYVIEGQLELTVGDQTFLLGEDDSFFFRSELPHGYRNPGPGRTRVIFINSPPSF